MARKRWTAIQEGKVRPPLSPATKGAVAEANAMLDEQTKRINPPPPEEHGIFAVGQVITINGLPFRVARFGERELHLRLDGKGKLVWRKRPARRAKARRK
jgi:hypothetical protein